MERLVTTHDLTLLQELQATLDNDGITSVIEENNSTIIDASGNIITYSLLVNKPDYAKAAQIYGSLNKEIESRDEVWCPECGSEDLSRTQTRHKHSSLVFIILAPILMLCGLLLPLGSIISWLFIAGSILFIIQFFRGYTEELFHCNKCGNTFKRY